MSRLTVDLGGGEETCGRNEINNQAERKQQQHQQPIRAKQTHDAPEEMQHGVLVGPAAGCGLLRRGGMVTPERPLTPTCQSTQVKIIKCSFTFLIKHLKTFRFIIFSLKVE